MFKERKKMGLNGLSAPVLGVEERSDEVIVCDRVSATRRRRELR